MNRSNSSCKDYRKNDSYTNEEYNNELESYLYAEVYYTQNEQDGSVNTTYSRDSPHISSKHDSSSKKHGVSNTPLGKTNYNRSKKFPPPFRGISCHLSQQGVSADSSSKGVKNYQLEEELYNTNNTNRYNQEENYIPTSSNHNNQHNKAHIKSKAVRQHIRFAEEDLQNLSNDLNTTEIQSSQLNLSNVSISSTSPIANTQLTDSSSSNVPGITYSGDVNTKNCKAKNILKKYEPSKHFIKNLYSQKYQELEKRYQKKKKKKKNKQEYTVENLLNDNELQSKYNIAKKSKKKKLAIEESSKHDDTLSDSDTDESILEVPIPPKPQPPLISLNDSDEENPLTNEIEECKINNDKLIATNSPAASSELDFLNISNIEDIENEVCQSNARTEYLTVHDRDMTLRAPDVAYSVQTEDFTEDIVLNCTEIQRNDQSLTDLKNTCKTAQRIQKENNLRDVTKNQTTADIGDISNSNDQSGKEVTSATDNSESTQINSVENLQTDKDCTQNVDNIHTSRIDATAVSFASSSERKRKIKKGCSDSSVPTNNKRAKHTDEGRDVVKLQSDIRPSSIQGAKNKWDEYFFKPMTQEMKKYYNESFSENCFDIKEVQKNMSKDPRLWGILDQDLMPSPSKRNKGRCNHCHQDGHTRINCPEPRRPPLCYMCGVKGHSETRCPQKMCLTCGKKQSTYRKTCETCRKYRCARCKAIGHVDVACPDLWRRYHDTTSSEVRVPDNPVNIMKPMHLLYCCNCAKQGHDSTTCNTYRWSPHYQTPMYVTSYTDGPQYEREARLSDPHNAPKDNPSARTQNAEAGTGNKILFSYGTIINGFVQMKQKVTKDSYYLSGVSNGQIQPYFLDYLSEHLTFYVEFRLLKSGSIEIYCSSKQKLVRYIMDLIKLWFSMQDDEKDRWVISELPYDRKMALTVIIKKFEQAKKTLVSCNDPKTLLKRIFDMKQQLKNVNNDQLQQSTFCKLKDDLLSLQTKLIILLHNKPHRGVSYNHLCKIQKCFEKAASISIGNYLDALHTYHVTFAPRTPKTIDKIIKRYYKHVKKPKNSVSTENTYYFTENTDLINEPTAPMQQDQVFKPSSTVTLNTMESLNAESEWLVNARNTSDLGHTSLEYPCNLSDDNCNLTQSSSNAPSPNFQNNIGIDDNTTTIAVEKNSPSDIPNSEKYSNNPENAIQAVADEFRNKEFDLATPVANDNTTVAVDVDFTADVDITDIGNDKTNTNSIDSHPSTTEEVSIESATCNNKLTFDTCDVTIAGKKQVVSEIQSNIELPNSCQETSNMPSESKTINNMQCNPPTINQEPDVIIKKELDVCIIETKSKSFIGSKLSEDLIEKAKCIINTALDFQLSYMNKAVTEVQKRLNDNTLEQKHIDVLQKLIDLEKLHQEHVNTFSKFLE